MLTTHAVFLPSYKLLSFETLTLIWMTNCKAIEAGLREKDTDKLNFNPREKQPVSHKPLVYENNEPVSLQISMQFNIRTYSSSHVALKIFFSCPFLPHAILRAAKIIVCAHALYSTYVASRSITFEKELFAG